MDKLSSNITRFFKCFGREEERGICGGARGGKGGEGECSLASIRSISFPKVKVTFKAHIKLEKDTSKTTISGNFKR